MPPASLSTLAVMMPGPTMASSISRRTRRGRMRCWRAMSASPGLRALREAAARVAAADGLAVHARDALLPGRRDDLVERVVGGDDAVEFVLLVHHRHGQQVVLGDHLRHALLALVQAHA